MGFWRSRGWLVVLFLGYLLFFGILISENVAKLNALGRMNSPALRAEVFRAGWVQWCLAASPTRWFIEVPCQRIPSLSLAIFLPAALLLGAGYLGGLRAVQRQPEAWPLPRLLRCALLAALPLLLMVPITSRDWVAYLLAGRIISVHHLSPWHHPLAEFPSEFIYLAPSEWGPQLKCIYGPVWVAVMALTTGISHLLAPGEMTLGGLLLNMLLLRLANLGALLGAALAVWRIQDLLGRRQQRLVTAAFLLNPLLVWESLGALHNDVWGLAFLLWAYSLFLRDDRRFTLPLALSILTKYMAFAVTPFLALYYWRRKEWSRLGWLALAVLISLGITALTDPRYVTSRLAANAAEFDLSPTSTPLSIVCAVALARDAGSPSIEVASVLQLAKLMTLLFAPVTLVLLWRTRTREQVIRHTAAVLALYLTTVYIQTMPWYFLWPLGLSCALPWTPAVANAVSVSCAVLLGYVMYFWTHGGWSPGSQLIAFTVSVALPTIACIAARNRGWSLGVPAGAFSPDCSDLRLTTRPDLS